MTIGKKLYMGFGLIMAIVVVAFLVNWLAVRHEQTTRALYKQSITMVESLSRLDKARSENRLFLRNFLLNGDRREADALARGQGEVAEVVGGELHLPALGRTHLGRCHQARVVDQDVQRAVPRGGERRDRRLVGKIQRRDQDLLVAGRRDDVLGGALSGRQIADRERDLRARARQGPGGLDADPGCPSGHDDAAAGEIDAVDHLGGGGLGAERRGDEAGHERSRLVRRCDQEALAGTIRSGGTSAIAQS